MEEVFASYPKEGEPWDVVIVGSGPAGLTAAIYTTRGAASTLIIGGSTWGGQLMLTTTVDNYPGFPKGIMGPVLMAEMKAQAERFGAKFVGADLTLIDTTKTPFEVTAEESLQSKKHNSRDRGQNSLARCSGCRQFPVKV